jgi:hypothetical protein
MSNIISINEIKIKSALKEADAVLTKTKTMIIEGVEVPDNLVPRLEAVIANLEKQLVQIVEED